MLELENLEQRRGRASAMSRFRASTLAVTFQPGRPDPEPLEPDPVLWQKLAKLTKAARVFTAPPPPPPVKRVAATPKLEFQRIRRRKGRLIDPRSSQFATLWDCVATTAIFFVAIVTPFEVCFLPSPKSYSDPLFVLNRIVDCAFIVDCVINFFLIYTTFDVRRGHMWVEDHRQIVMHYLKGTSCISSPYNGPPAMTCLTVARRAAMRDLSHRLVCHRRDLDGGLGV